MCTVSSHPSSGSHQELWCVPSSEAEEPLFTFVCPSPLLSGVKEEELEHGVPGI